MNIYRTAAVVAISVALAFVVTGCGPQNRPPEAKMTDADPGVAENPFGISAISVNASPGTISEPTNTGDPIVITVTGMGKTLGADLEVKLFALADGSVAASEKLRLDATSEAEQTITFDSANPWKPGRYLVEVTLDGSLAGHRELDVVGVDPAVN